MRDNNKWLLLTSAAALALGTASIASADTLDDTRERGTVQCGVSDGLPGFSAPDDQGEWQGLDVDVCRAVAAAVFGDADAVREHARRVGMPADEISPVLDAVVIRDDPRAAPVAA